MAVAEKSRYRIALISLKLRRLRGDAHVIYNSRFANTPANSSASMSVDISASTSASTSANISANIFANTEHRWKYNQNREVREIEIVSKLTPTLNKFENFRHLDQ